VLRRVAALLLAVTAVGFSASSASGGAYPGRNGVVAFAREDFTTGLQIHIWTVDPVTLEETQLTNVPNALDQQPKYSPDGTRIAFSRDLGNQGAIYVMGADGSSPTALTADDGNTCPTWSPDGTKLAYSNGPGNIVIIDVATKAVLDTLTSVQTCELSWSPLGDLIAFDAPTGISVIAPVSGATPTPVTNDPTDSAPTWSPDGIRIAFSRGQAGSGHIVSVRADGADEIDVTTGDDDVTPGWSPDGALVAFTRADFDDVSGRLLKVAAGGGTPSALTAPADGEADFQPDWQPLAAPPPPPPPPPPAPPVPVAPTFTG